MIGLSVNNEGKPNWRREQAVQKGAVSSTQYHPHPVLHCYKFVGRMIEALTDPKTWLFALFAAFNNIPTSVTNQFQIIIVSFGFNPIQTTLLGCVFGVVEIVSILTGVTIASRIPNSIAWVEIVYFVPNFLGVLLVNFLPWHDKVGLLFPVWITGTNDVKMQVHLTLVIRFRGHWFCVKFDLGVANDGWAYKESYNECHHAICVLHWQCCWAVHVEG